MRVKKRERDPNEDQLELIKAIKGVNRSNVSTEKTCSIVLIALLYMRQKKKYEREGGGGGGEKKVFKSFCMI